ncbi:MAG: hypothetical protein V1753_02620 [Pseudomonadota bacterium]
MIQKIFFRLMIACFLCVLFGCVSAPNQSSQISKPKKGKLYDKAIQKWTREGRIYREFDLELLVSATFRGSEYQAAYAQKYAHTYLLSSTDSYSLKQDQLKAAEEFIDFVMATFIPDDLSSDFEKKDSTWKIYLTNDQHDRMDPIEIRRLDKKDPLILEFFPFVTPWRDVYQVRFSPYKPESKERFILPATRSVGLTITGIPGTCTLIWELKGE